MTALPIYVIYDHPKDAPQGFVVRLWLNDPAGRRHRVGAWVQAREAPQPAG